MNYLFVPHAKLGAALLAVLAVSASAQSTRERAVDARAAAVGADVAWYVPLPVGFTTRITSYELLEGILYAIGDDGRVRAVDASNGLLLWSAGLTRGGLAIMGPVAYVSGDPDVPQRAAVFTTFSNVLLVDALTGRTFQRVRPPAPPTASVVAYDHLLFTPAVGNRVHCTDIETDAQRWQIGAHGPIQLPPLYMPHSDLLVIADDTGMIRSCDSKRDWQFTAQVEGEPRGWLAHDATAIYITTAGDVPAIHALDRSTGKPLREPYRLAGRPEGGPVVTKTAVYQALAEGGVHCVGLTPEAPSWFNPEARVFLAEWRGRVAVLRMDGMIELVDTSTRRPAGILDLGVRCRSGVSNTLNDAALVGTEKGEIWCIRPAGAGPMNAATFRVPTTRPATRPAQDSDDDLITREAAPRPAPRPAAPPALAPAPEPANAAPPAPAPPPDDGGASLRGRIEDQLNRALENRPGE